MLTYKLYSCLTRHCLFYFNLSNIIHTFLLLENSFFSSVVIIFSIMFLLFDILVCFMPLDAASAMSTTTTTTTTDGDGSIWWKWNISDEIEQKNRNGVCRTCRHDTTRINTMPRCWFALLFDLIASRWHTIACFIFVLFFIFKLDWLELVLILHNVEMLEANHSMVSFDCSASSFQAFNRYE